MRIYYDTEFTSLDGNVDWDMISAGFVADRGPRGQRFNPNKVLFDPYAREMTHTPMSRAVIEAGAGPAIFAVGDATEVTQTISGMPALIPLAGPANRQGRIAADNMLKGPHTVYKGTLGTAIMLSMLFGSLPTNITSAMSNTDTATAALDAALDPAVANAPQNKGVMDAMWTPITEKITSQIDSKMTDATQQVKDQVDAKVREEVSKAAHEKAAEGASQLADGAGKLSTGLGKTIFFILH